MERRPPRGRGPRPRRGEPRRVEPLEPHPRDLVEQLVRRLVPEIEDLSVEEERQEGSRVVTVTVDPSHVGAVIGRGGCTAQALRTLLGVAAARHRTRIQLEIKG